MCVCGECFCLFPSFKSFLFLKKNKTKQKLLEQIHFMAEKGDLKGILKGHIYI